MDVQLTADQKALIDQAIASGRIQAEEDAVRQALSLWEERERRRCELLAMLDEADASLERGEGIAVNSDQELTEFIDDVKRRGMERFKACTDTR
jgi:Arc/MetJ-type ribon-helix-helix transcriptional regulator